MNFRIAKKSDCRDLAKVHYDCSRSQVDGFMYRLGLPFLIEYYRIFTCEKNSLIVLAEENDIVMGFHSGTMLAEEHQEALSVNKIKLGISVILSLLKDVRMMPEIIKRYRSLSNLEDDFRVKSGPRGEYWAWRPDKKNAADALKLHKIWHNMLRDLGATYVRSEVDLSNKRVVKSILLMGGIFINELVLEDGRKRAIVELKL